MLNIIDDEGDVYLGYVEDDFWTKSYGTNGYVAKHNG